MRKNFGSKTWLYPMPVLIVGAYDENSRIDVKILDTILFESVTHSYWDFGKKVGQAFSDGKQLQ